MLGAPLPLFVFSPAADAVTFLRECLLLCLQCLLLLLCSIRSLDDETLRHLNSKACQLVRDLLGQGEFGPTRSYLRTVRVCIGIDPQQLPLDCDSVRRNPQQLLET